MSFLVCIKNSVTINSVKIEDDQVIFRPMTATVKWTRPADNDMNDNAFYMWIEGAKEASAGMSSYIAKGETEELFQATW